jgi:hypothetical protein
MPVPIDFFDFVLDIFARTILNTLRRDKIRTAREALHGAKRPSSRTPESKKTLGTAERLALAIEALETASAYSRQVFQRLVRRDSAAGQCVLNALAKMIEGHVRGHNHECLTELDEQNLTPLREVVQLAVSGRNCNPSFFSYSDGFNRTSSLRWHDNLLCESNLCSQVLQVVQFAPDGSAERAG